MTFEQLDECMKLIGSGNRLPAQLKKRIEAELPSFIVKLKSESTPKRIKLPTGETLVNASRMTALKCHCLLLARTAFGVHYLKTDPSYEVLAKDLLFWVMRHHFNTGDPKGVFCCAPCTLSFLPLYALSSFKWVDCEELKRNVLDELTKRSSVFKSSYPEAYSQWAKGIAK
jgi:hypothetical protein